MWQKDLFSDLGLTSGYLFGVVATNAPELPVHSVNIETPWTLDSPCKSVTQVWFGFGLFYIRVEFTRLIGSIQGRYDAFMAKYGHPPPRPDEEEDESC